MQSINLVYCSLGWDAQKKSIAMNSGGQEADPAAVGLSVGWEGQNTFVVDSKVAAAESSSEHMAL